MATAVAQKPYVPSAIRKILQELPGMTDNRYERITEALHRLPNKIRISQLKFLYPLKTLVFPAFLPPRFGPFPSFFPLREEMRETFFQAVPTTLSSSLAEVRLASLVAWA